MTFRWLKNYMPRSLYGRAALILIVPIVTIQLVVSIVFIQRHFEDVTRQMTENILRELTFLAEEIETSETLADALDDIEELVVPLAMAATLPAQKTLTEGRYFYDLSGRVIINTLHLGLGGITAVDLRTDDHLVMLTMQTRHGPLLIEFPRWRVSASNPHQLLVLMIATSLLMTLIAFLFLRNQLRPIRRLARASEAFGKGQNVPYYPSGATEVRAAGGAFLNMRARIERQIEQRTMMLSGVSHDLRTPLTRMRLGLSMMDESEERTAIEQDVSDMEQLLEAFLNFAKGDAADELEKTDPVALVKSCVEKSARNGKSVHLFEVEGDGRMPLRPVAITRAIDNLIGNALRYGNRAEVSILLSDKMVRIRVEDDGPGIAPEDRAEALKPFSRLEPARNQNKGSGTGLGLSIVNDIARSHGGTLRLGESARLGGLQADIVIAR